METNWEDEYIRLGTNMDAETLWEILKTKILDLRNEFVPRQTITGKPTWQDIGSFPINKTLQEAIRNKHVLHRRWMKAKNRNHDETARLAYTKARNKVKTGMRQAKKGFEKGIAKNSKTNPKEFWSYVRRKLKTKSGVAPLLENVKDKDSTRFDDKQKANILQEQLASVFTYETEG